jgi:tetratricopeptide (TPR) repeat protein
LRPKTTSYSWEIPAIIGDIALSGGSVAMSNEAYMVDFFVSRRGSAAPAAQEVADVLASAGYRVTVQDYDIPIGENFIVKMHEALKRARHFIALLTKDYVDGPFTQEEWTNFLALAAPGGGERRLIVLRVEDCVPTGLLAGRVFGDLVGVTDPAKRRAIILAAAEGRALPRPQAARIVRNIPPHNPGFVGRDDVLDELHRTLAKADCPTAITQAAIFGLGGIGKTTLAAEYAHRHLDHYAGIWWVSAESRTSLIESLAELGSLLDRRRSAASGAGDRDLEALAKAALQMLGESEQPWLLVYDNVVKPEHIRDLVPSTGAKILITTRWTDWYGQAVPVEIDVLPASEATDLLLRITGLRDRKGAAQLAQSLGHLPLALNHAGAYIRGAGISFARYAERAAELIAKAPTGTSYPQSVAATLGLAIERAVQECATAEKLLGFLSMLGPDQIPHDLIDRSILAESDRDEALAALHRVSLVKYQANDGDDDANQAIFIHRLVRAAMHGRLRETGKIDGAVRLAVERLARAFPDRGYGDPRCWPRCKELLAHALAAYDTARDLRLETEALAELADAAGNYLLGRNIFAEAEPLFVNAVAIGERVLGPEHVKVGQWLNNLANLYLNSGRYDEAEPRYWRSISIGVKTLGESDTGVATRMNNLAMVLMKTGRASLAEKYFRKAIDVTETALGRKHELVARRRHNLADLLRDSGRRKQADALYRDAIAIGQATLGADNFHVCTWQKDRASLLRDMGKYAQAERLYKRALASFIATVGANHSSVAFTREDYAEFLLRTGRCEEAHAQATEAVALHEQTFGIGHRWTRGAAQVLADILVALGRADEAVELCGRHGLPGPRPRRRSNGAAQATRPRRARDLPRRRSR